MNCHSKSSGKTNNMPHDTAHHYNTLFGPIIFTCLTWEILGIDRMREECSYRSLCTLPNTSTHHTFKDEISTCLLVRRCHPKLNHYTHKKHWTERLNLVGKVDRHLMTPYALNLLTTPITLECYHCGCQTRILEKQKSN